MPSTPHVNITFKDEPDLYKKLGHLSVDLDTSIPEMARRLLRALASDDPRALAIVKGTEPKGKGIK